MNYTIIVDEEKLQNFIDWLPDLKDNEQYYITLFSRKKYDTNNLGLKSDKGQLKRTTATKDRIIQKIRQMECKIGSYYHDNIPVPNNTLAIYISLNPRDLIKASKNTVKELIELIFNKQDNFNPKSIVLSNIQKACSRKIYMDFEIDGKTQNVNTIREYVTNACKTSDFKIIETRGGYHILIKLDSIPKEYNKSWYLNMTKLEGVDQTNIDLLPIPGCAQGGYVPHFI